MGLAHMSFILSLLVGLIDFVGAQDSGDSFDDDPILQYRPAFARSLPVQILLTGIVVTLVVVLLVHLVFTAKYHWSLAPTNYVLQISGVCTLLISLAATLHVVLNAALRESKQWPYMLSYIAVNVPPLYDRFAAWSVTETITWLIMNASTSGLVQVTHIQFLTLLYPSRLEALLIYLLLGPLAILAAVMQVITKPESAFVASMVRNICNATLSLIFTTALFIWGFLVNRRQAWRTDGGTAVFGAGALTLTLFGTALNLLYVPREEEYVWLPGLMLAVVLWQSFLGFWWWVGAGHPADLQASEERWAAKEKKEITRKEKQEKRKDAKQRAKRKLSDVSGALPLQDGSPPLKRSSSANAISEDSNSQVSRQRDLSRNPEHSSIPSLRPPLRWLPHIVRKWCDHIRRAHLNATRAQIVELAERMRERETTRRGVWGLNLFGLTSSAAATATLATAANGLPDGAAQDHEREQKIHESDGLFYWGPLRRWRLRDSTVY